MKQTLKKLSVYIFPALLVLITIFIAWKNYTPGTWLSGWDTLHPEFNFSLYLKRVFWGVWQEHQGVGAVASQAHAAELTRIPILFLLSLVLPLSAVRYGFFFLTLIAGTLGSYFFLKYNIYGKTASFLGALFYLLNLATVQQYYVPFEMFALHFATLPWLFLLTTAFLKEGRKKFIVLFALVTLLASGIAHTPTLFYVYFGALGLFVGIYWLLERNRTVFKRSVAILAITLSLNLFWILPNLYFVKNHAVDVENSKINGVFSDEAFLQSKTFGDLKDLALFKNFLFNWRAYTVNGNTFDDLLKVWIDHLNKPYVAQIGYFLSSFVILGTVLTLLKRQKVGFGLLGISLICIFFWINENPPFTAIFTRLRDIKFFSEVFRFPFTKFSFLLSFSASYFFAYIFSYVFKNSRFVKFLGFIAVVSALIVFCLPVFQGELISPLMRIKIPNEYFQAFNWFKNAPDGRVAKLPLQTFWGWNFYSWNYQGAGFTWFGIPQPTLDREFDRWSTFNEDFYSQVSSAVYSQDLPALEKVLDKYQVKYLLLDESIVNAGGSEKLLYIPEIKKLLSGSGHIKEATKFGFISIYQTDFGGEQVSAPTYLYRELAPLDLKEILSQSKLIASEDFKKARGFSEAYNCDLKKIGEVGKKNLGDKIIYSASDGGVSCDYFDYPDLSYSQGYVLRIKGQNIDGRSLKIYLQNWTTNRMDIEELLPKGSFDELYFVTPKNMDGEGYSLNVETRSYGRVGAENALEQVEIYELPKSLSISLLFDTNSTSSLDNNLKILEVKQMGSFYRVETSGSGLLELGQGYEDGWVALASHNFQLLKHTKVNGWANGWLLSERPTANNQLTTVTIFFWPQVLEFAGLVAAVLILVFLSLTRVGRQG